MSVSIVVFVLFFVVFVGTMTLAWLASCNFNDKMVLHCRQGMRRV